MINFSTIKFNTNNYINKQKANINKPLSFKGLDRDTIYINKRNDNRYEENLSSKSTYKPFLSEDEILLKIREKNEFLKDFAIFARYSSDFKKLAKATYKNGEGVFKRRSGDTTEMINSLYTRRKEAEFRGIRSPHQIDYDAIQSILNTKYSKPENEKPINDLFKKFQQGYINLTQLKTYSYMLYAKTLAPKTISKLADVNFKATREWIGSWDRVLDEEKLSKFYGTEAGTKLFNLKQKMGRDFYVFKWSELIDENTTEEDISALTKDLPELYKREQLKLKPEAFFIKMKHFGQNNMWAERMCDISDYATELIRNGESFEYVINTIAEEGAELNYSLFDGINKAKAEDFGVLRTTQDNLSTTFARKKNKYGEYVKKFKKLTKSEEDKTFSVKTPKEFPNLPKTELKLNTLNGEMIHPSGKNTFITMHYAKELYDKIIHSKNKNIIPLNENIAKLHWVFAHGMPFKRGSDSIANILVKSIYRANDVKIGGLREDTSLDLEAFSTNLNEYIEKYPYLYELPPQKLY